MTLAIAQPTKKKPVKPIRVSRAYDGLIKDAAAGLIEIVPLTIEQYDALTDAGWEDKTVELLDGLLIRKIRGTKEDPMSIGDRHAFAVMAVGKLDRHVEAHGGHVRTQNPLVVWDESKPEPDAAIVRGTLYNYVAVTPTSAETSCVIEVADASLSIDRKWKRQVYAFSDIPQYVILNLVKDQAEIHEDPDPATGVYRSTAVAQAGDTIQLLLPDGSRLDVAVSDLIPG